MSFSHLSDDNHSYCVVEKRRKKDVQNIIIQAVDCSQLSVLISISIIAYLMTHLGKEREKVKLFSRLDGPFEHLIQSGGDCVQDFDPT